MLRNNIIRKISSGFLLALFVFCITPKKMLHDLLADHKDTPFSSANAAHQQFDRSGFRCNCDNLVVESPFISDYIPVDLHVPVLHISHFANLSGDFSFLNPIYFQLRGPPCLA